MITAGPRRRARRALAAALGGALALGGARSGAAPALDRAVDGPIEVAADGAGSAEASAPEASAERDENEASTAASPARRPPPPRIDARATPWRVAVGLGPTAPGTATERALLDRLEGSLAASTLPVAEVRRLRPGAGEARMICRERRDDLIVLVDYLPERDEPVLLPHECALDQALGVRAAAAADEPGLLTVLWEERQALLAAGAEERRARIALSPRVRRGLLAGGAIVALGVAIGVVLVASLRPSTAVITVSP